MISVLISSESRYIVNRDQIRQAIRELLVNMGLDEVEVSVSVVGGRKIRSLNRQWREIDKVTDVLSFPLEEARNADGILRLGDIVICYPKAREDAQKENIMMDNKLNELTIHGLKHLLGEHHEE